MSSSAIQETTSEVETEIFGSVISEEKSNLNTETVSVHHSSEDSDLSGEEYWDELFDYDESRAENARWPRQGHRLRHGKLIEKRGSNQEKFISSRPKALVRYRKHLFTASADDIDEQAKGIINECVEKYGYYSFVDINSTILSGERSVLVHVPGRLNENTGERQEYLIKVYRQLYGVERGDRWLSKAYSNSDYMRKYANVPYVFCPTHNVGQMYFIGDDGIPAPNLYEVPFEITEKIYNDVITTVRRLYNEGKVVHGKLSAETILWWKDKLWFISLSHSLETSDPKALQMLMKDCCHITHFFKSKGLPKVKSIIKLFKYITNLEKIDDHVLYVLRNTRKPVKHRQRRRQHRERA